MNKIWINGAEGFIGGWLSRVLSKDHANSIILSSQKGENTIFGEKTCRLDINSSVEVGAFIETHKPLQVYHLAALSHPKDSFLSPKQTYVTNVIGSINILDGIKRNSPETEVLLASTSAVYGNISGEKKVTENDQTYPLSPYGASKLAMEQAGLQYHECFGTKCKIVRIFNTTGPGKDGDVLNDFISRLILDENVKEQTLRVGDVSTKRPFIDVRDTVNALMIAMNDGEIGKVYNICGEQLYSPRDIIGSLEELLNTKITIQHDSGLLRTREEKIIKGDCSRIKELGWTAQYNFKETVNDAYKWRVGL